MDVKLINEKQIVLINRNPQYGTTKMTVNFADPNIAKDFFKKCCNPNYTGHKVLNHILCYGEDIHFSGRF